MLPAVHYVGFRAEEYWSAVKVWGRPGYVECGGEGYASWVIDPKLWADIPPT